MYYTVYKVTNKMNGKTYIGKHKTKNLEDGYMGSGKYLNRAIEKHGLEAFIKEILFVFDTREEMNAKEAELVNEDYLTEGNTYNLKLGGEGGFDYINEQLDINYRARGSKGGIQSSKSVTKEQLTARTNSRWLRYRNKYLNHLEFVRSLGVVAAQSASARAKRIASLNKLDRKGSNSHNYGKRWITNGIHSHRIKRDDLIPTGWWKGRMVKPKTHNQLKNLEDEPIEIGKCLENTLLEKSNGLR